PPPRASPDRGGRQRAAGGSRWERGRGRYARPARVAHVPLGAVADGDAGGLADASVGSAGGACGAREGRARAVRADEAARIRVHTVRRPRAMEAIRVARAERAERALVRRSASVAGVAAVRRRARGRAAGLPAVRAVVMEIDARLDRAMADAR